MSRSSTRSAAELAGRRSVQARVALTLLEAIRERDRPGEVLDDEDVSITMPRRLGLSSVVDTQIRRYSEEARRKGRIPESEVRDLIRLVAKRPDAGDIFHQVGRALVLEEGLLVWRRVLPQRLSYALARRRVRWRLRDLFGATFVRSEGVPFQIEGTHGMLSDETPGGEACGLVTGLCEAVLERYEGKLSKVSHPTCRGRGDDACRWVLAASLD